MERFRNLKLPKIVLALSLALNLAVVGVVVGAWLGGGGRHHEARENSARWSVGPFGRALSKEDRREMGERFRKNKSGELRKQRSALRSAALNMVDALRADPFDPDTVAQILQDQRSLGVSQRALGHGILLDQINSMTPDERDGFAGRLEEALSRRRPVRD